MAREKAESKVGKYADLDYWNKKGNIKTGDEIDGYLFDSESFNTKYGQARTYIFKNKDGKMFKVSGQTDIVNKMDNAYDRITDKEIDPVGVHFWIKYEGITETKNGAMKVYNVEYDVEDRLNFD